MTPRITACLRRAAAERRMKGDENARDLCIVRFLGEMQQVFTPRYIETLGDQALADLFEDWIKALPHMAEEERIDALIQDVRLCQVPFLVYRKGVSPRQAGPADPPPQDNVVSLHAR